MIRFPGSGKACAIAACALMVLAAGCGAGREQATAAARPRTRSAGPRPARSAYVKRADFLAGVTCLPARTCIAVGGYYYGTARPPLTLAERWTGRAWLAEPTPGRGRENGLDSISCATASWCLALGTPTEAWNGTRWSVIPSPPGIPPSSVSCPAPRYCQAVGPPPFGTRPAAARWDGRAWQAEQVPTPRPAPQNLTLAAVSCATVSFCMAVGDYSYGAQAMPSPTYRDRTLAERWNGTRWRTIPAPSPAHASRFTGVSCLSPTACVAVGSSASDARTLAERWNGARWTVQHTPDIHHFGYSSLTAVSCATAASCMAVGTFDDGVFGIAEHWDGNRWTIRRLPLPPGPPGEDPLVLPAGVSCTSATACVTVGTTQNQTMAERWNGSTWTVQRTPNPA